MFRVINKIYADDNFKFFLILNRVTQEVRIVSIFLINYQKSNNTDNV